MNAVSMTSNRFNSYDQEEQKKYHYDRLYKWTWTEVILKLRSSEWFNSALSPRWGS